MSIVCTPIDTEELQLAIQDYDRALFGIIEQAKTSRSQLAEQIIESLNIENEILEVKNTRAHVASLIERIIFAKLTEDAN